MSAAYVISENWRAIEQCETYTTYGKFIKPAEELEFIVQAYDEFSIQRD